MPTMFYQRILTLSAFLLLGLFGGFGVFAQAVPVLELYYGQECPHCHQEMEWLPTLEKMYPDLRIDKYEVWHNPENKKLWEARMKSLGQLPQGVPTNIVKNDLVVGFIAEDILAIIEKNYGTPVGETIEKPKSEVSNTTDEDWKKYLQWSWPAMSFMLGLADGFNPCALWSLIVLLGFLLAMDDHRKRWLIGGVFLGVSGLMYLLVLLGYLFGFHQMTVFVAGPVMEWIFRIVGVLAIITGIMAIKNAWESKTECTIRDTESKKQFHKKLKNIFENKNIWLVLVGITGLAISVNAIELLCSFAIPTAFTATLVSSGLSLSGKFSAIVIYDLAYMLDDIIMFTVAMWTLNLKIISQKILVVSNFLGGTLLLLIGSLLLVKPELLSWFS